MSKDEVETAFTEWLKTALSDLWVAQGESLDNWDKDDKLDVFKQYYAASARRAGGGEYEITEDLTMKRIKQPSLLDFLGGSE